MNYKAYVSGPDKTLELSFDSERSERFVELGRLIEQFRGEFFPRKTVEQFARGMKHDTRLLARRLYVRLECNGDSEEFWHELKPPEPPCFGPFGEGASHWWSVDNTTRCLRCGMRSFRNGEMYYFDHIGH